eukprot:10946-Eustigmatos_ZCMA.PRE.1
MTSSPAAVASTAAEAGESTAPAEPINRPVRAAVRKPWRDKASTHGPCRSVAASVRNACGRAAPLLRRACAVSRLHTPLERSG